MKLITVEIIDAINKAKKELEHPLIEGKISNYENYKYQIGLIHGLQYAIEICNNTVRRRNDE